MNGVSQQTNGYIPASKLYEMFDQVRKGQEDMRKEIVQSVQRVEDKLDALEDGRVAMLEKTTIELQAKFTPVQKAVYGAVGLILTAITLAVIALVLV